MNPNTLQQAEAQHGNNEKGAAIADEWQWQAGNWSNANGHANIHECMGEK